MNTNPLTKYTCIYAHYNRQQKVSKYVIDFLKSLSDTGCQIIFVSNSAIGPVLKERLAFHIPGINIHCRENKGYDFGAWKWALENQTIPTNTTHLLLANDSFIGPLNDLGAIMRSMHERNVDFWGLTDAAHGNWYIESYFYVVSKKAFLSTAFRKVFSKKFNSLSREEVALEGELALSESLSNAGLTFSVYVSCDMLDPGASGNQIKNAPTYYFADVLILNFNFPFIRKGFILNNPGSLTTGGLNIFDLVRKHSIYDIDNIMELIESACECSENKSDEVRLSAICHLYYPHTIFSFLIKLSRLKAYRTRFIMNISSSLYLDENFNKLLDSIFPEAIILYTTPKGRDIGGKLAAIDVLIKLGISSEYTLIIHDKLSPHTPFGYKWRDELLKIIQEENIAGVLGKFRNNKGIGLIASDKFIQNEYDPDKRTFRCTSSFILEQLIRQFNFTIKDFSFSAGSIFWIRTAILKTFFKENKPLEMRKTLEAGNVLDFNKGTYVHGWERVFSLMANAYGYKIYGM